MSAVPKGWLVQAYSEAANGWHATAGTFCPTRDAAVAFAKRCAIVSPGCAYVVFESVEAWRTAPGEPIEEVLE